MLLSIDKGYKESIGKGIFIGEATIVSCENISGKKLPYMKNACDLGIEMILDIGKSWQPRFSISGDLQRDPKSNEVIGWGSAFRVRDFLQRVGWDGKLNTDNTLPDEVFTWLPGKKFLKLGYISGTKPDGKRRYSDWKEIASLEEGEAKLAARFLESAAKGFPRNYDPSLLDGDTTFPSVDKEKFQL